MTDEPMPRDFGWRYILWVIWTNAITLLVAVQGLIATLALDGADFSPKTIHVFMISNAVACAILAQIKRNSPPPTKGP